MVTVMVMVMVMMMMVMMTMVMMMVMICFFIRGILPFLFFLLPVVMINPSSDVPVPLGISGKS
eukprot:11498775-Karenia_brevis.AAC.1